MMTITSELTSMENNVTSIYNKLEEKGATIPTNKNLVNIPDTIDTISNEPDYTAMANELKKAACWTYTFYPLNYCQLYDAYHNIFSDPFQASSLNISKLTSYISASSNSSINFQIVIDGKLYNCSSSTSGITLTQQGVDTDWNRVYIYNKYCMKNNKFYNTVSDAINDTNVKYTNPDISTIKYSHFYRDYMVINGNLYLDDQEKICSGKYWISAGAYLTGNYNGVGYNSYDKKLYSISLSNYSTAVINNNVIIESNDLWASDGYANMVLYANGKNLYGYYYSSPSTIYSKELDSNIKKIISASRYNGFIILLENGELYYCNNYEVARLSKFTLTNVQDIGGYYDSCCAITRDNKLYKITYSNSNWTSTLIKTFEVSTEFILDNDNERINAFKYIENNPIEYNKYTVQYVSAISTAYDTYLNQSNTSNVSEATNSYITINENIYYRNQIRDNVFTFIPPDLENYNFNGYELCQTYLNAGEN